MPTMKIEKVKSRAEQGFALRDANRDIYYAIEEFFTPYDASFRNQAETFTRPQIQYASTPQKAFQNFKASMTRFITPPDARFAVLQAGVNVVDKAEKKKMNKILDAMNDVIYAYLNKSNFWTAIDDAYGELAKGTMALWCRETNQQDMPFDFVSTPISNLGLSTSANNEIDFIARKHNVRVDAIKAIYPEAELTSELEQMVKDKADAEVELLEVQYEDKEDHVWRFEVIHGTDRLYEKEWIERACFTPRWQTAVGKPFGLGVCMHALADVKVLNASMKLFLEGLAYTVYPLYTIAGDDTLNPNAIELSPNTFLPVDSNANDNPTIRPLPTGGSYTAGKDLHESLAEEIRMAMLDNRLPQQQPQPVTALEISERINQFTADYGAVYARLRHELIIPLFKRILGVLHRAGKFSQIEGSDSIKLDELQTSVIVQSPIGRIQQAEEVQKTIEAFSIIRDVSPEVASIAFKVEEFPQWLMEKLGGAIELLSDDDAATIKQKVEERALAQQALDSGLAQQALANNTGGTGGA